MSRADATRAVVAASVRSTVGAGALIAAYYVWPEHFSGARAAVRVVIAAVVIGTVLVVQIRGISRARLPWLRAVEALALTVTSMVIVFAGTYHAMSRLDNAAFNEQLNHTSALYFTVTTLATVGYGDIHARTDGARIVVMIQMVWNVAVIGASIRLILTMARQRAGDPRKP